MIKEIEVGGVKHSITLADDMVGDGLVKSLEGALGVGIVTDVLSGGQFMTGLAISGGKLILQKDPIAKALSGNGLIAHLGGLSINTTGLAQNPTFISGLASGLAGSGINVVDGKLSVTSGDVNLATTGALFQTRGGVGISGLDLAGSGLFAETDFSEIGINICSGRGLCFLSPGVDVSVNRLFQSVAIKIVNRPSGLRLFFNSNGELDVTQD